jgi:formate-dependent nitrite reductase membrane component NrfD
MIARYDVHVRAPEQGTHPKLFYKGVDEASLVPTRTRIAEDGMIWAETTPHHSTGPVTLDDERELLEGGHITARTVYTTAHPMAWTGKVSAYLVTKAVASGSLMVAALMVLLGHADSRAAVGVLPAVFAGLFTAVTGVLLVTDLRQPRRFHYILTRPNWTSWLTRGAVILALFAAVSAAWLAAGVLDRVGLIEALAVPGFVLGAATAGYTAYLFGQCEGRDFWQTPLLLPVLLAQAVVAGAAVFLVADVVVDVPSVGALRWTLLGGVAAVGAFTFVELSSKHSVHVHLAAWAMTRGPYAARFWAVGVAAGLALPGVLMAGVLAGLIDGTAVGALAGVAALIGLAGYEDAFVRAGQSVPLS